MLMHRSARTDMQPKKQCEQTEQHTVTDGSACTVHHLHRLCGLDDGCRVCWFGTSAKAHYPAIFLVDP
jgi:hypothetical protein